MVSDDRWDELTVTRYPSVDLVEPPGDDTATAIVLITQPSSK